MTVEKVSLANDFLTLQDRKSFENYSALEYELEGLIRAEREDAQLRIENQKVHQGQRFAYYWSPGMLKPEKVTSMSRWDELVRQDRSTRALLRTSYVRGH